MARILIIDDERMVLSILRQALIRAGHEVLTADDGQEGQDRCPAFAPDLVITDIIMPGQEGIDTILGLRRIAPGVPIIAMSGGGQIGNTEILQMARKLGAAATLRKPFRPQELVAAVADVLGRAGDASAGPD